MTVRLIYFLLAALIIISLTACNKLGGRLNIPVNQVGSEDFQKNLHQTGRLSGLPSFVETDTGWYFSYGSLYYIEKETLHVTVVCGKPDCDHTDDSICNARIHANYLLNGGDKIYYVTISFASGKGERLVQSVKLDATDRETVQELKFQEISAATSSNDHAIYHRGYIYYVSDDILYRAALGAGKDTAQVIWSPENADETEMRDGFPIVTGNELHYTLWADGNSLYFMANLQVKNETYKDILFECNLNDLTVRQIWATPDKNEAGEWETTGVSVSQWYVKDGYIYFYLSGGDYWRGNLSTGKNEKLANTHEKTKYGCAVFSDDYMCLLNDTPKLMASDSTPYPGSPWRFGGDTIFIYGLDGTLIKEISLSSLYEEQENLASIELICCSGNNIFFRTSSLTYSELGGIFSGSQGNQGDVNLCHADIETGEVKVVYTLKKGQ